MFFSVILCASSLVGSEKHNNNIMPTPRLMSRYIIIETAVSGGLVCRSELFVRRFADIYVINNIILKKKIDT